MNTNDTVVTMTEPNANRKGGAGKIFNIIWNVFKGLFIAACIIALMFDTFIAIHYYKEDMNAPPIKMSTPYPYSTQDWEGVKEEHDKNPEDTKWKEMRRDFYVKYSIKYKDTETYLSLLYLHKHNMTDSEEYNQLMQELTEDFGITAEEVTFDE